MIKDSGERREFESGAVRDIQEGKGRCDLLPLAEVAGLLEGEDGFDTVLYSIHDAIEYQDTEYIYCAIREFIRKHMYYGRLCMEEALPDAMLEVAIHFEEGAKKYGDNNWRKGIPTHCYIDSGIRHYLKFLRGDVDERHDRAFIWNMLCFIWTVRNKPECDDVFNKSKSDSTIEDILYQKPKYTMADIFSLLREKESDQEHNPGAPSDSIAKANGITRIDGETIKYEESDPFYSEENINRIKQAISDADAGVNMLRHDYICPKGKIPCTKYEKNGGECNGSYARCEKSTWRYE